MTIRVYLRDINVESCPGLRVVGPSERCKLLVENVEIHGDDDFRSYIELQSFVQRIPSELVPFVDEVTVSEKIHSRPAVFSHGTARGEIDTFNKAGYNLRITGKTLEDVLALYQQALGVMPVVEQPVMLSTPSEQAVASATDEENDPIDIPQAILQAMSLVDENMDTRFAVVSTPIRNLVNLIFKKAVQVSASAISIRRVLDGSDHGWFICFFIDEEWKNWHGLPSYDMASMIISRLKLIAGWKLEEFTGLEETLVDIRINDNTYTCEFSIAPREYGEHASILIKKKDQGFIWNMGDASGPENIPLDDFVPKFRNFITCRMAADYRMVPIVQRGECLVLATDVQHVPLMVRQQLTAILDRPLEFVWVEKDKLHAALRKYYVVTEADLTEHK